MTFYMLLRIINETKTQFKFSENNCIVLFSDARFKINQKY